MNKNADVSEINASMPFAKSRARMALHLVLVSTCRSPKRRSGGYRAGKRGGVSRSTVATARDNERKQPKVTFVTISWLGNDMALCRSENPDTDALRNARQRSDGVHAADVVP